MPIIVVCVCGCVVYIVSISVSFCCKKSITLGLLSSSERGKEKKREAERGSLAGKETLDRFLESQQIVLSIEFKKLNNTNLTNGNTIWMILNRIVTKAIVDL